MRNLKKSLAALFISALVIILTMLIVSTGCVHAQTCDIDRKPEAPKNLAPTLDSVIADSVGTCYTFNDYFNDYLDIDGDGEIDVCDHDRLSEHMDEDPKVKNLITQCLWYKHFHTCLDKNSDGLIDDDQYPELYPKRYGTYVNPNDIPQQITYHGKEGKSEFGEYQPTDNFDWDQGYCGD